MRRFFDVLGLSAALAACVLVLVFTLGDLGRDSDAVMYAVIGCIGASGIFLWIGAQGADAPDGRSR